jgi:hypothetical protein
MKRHKNLKNRMSVRPNKAKTGISVKKHSREEIVRICNEAEEVIYHKYDPIPAIIHDGMQGFRNN